MKVLHIITIAALAILLVSCCSCRKGSSRNNKSLVKTEWTLIEMSGRAVDAGEGYKLTFDETEGRFSGIGDCNRISGPYTLSEKGKITLGNAISTRMMCSNQAQENQFLKMLGRVNSYKIDGDLLLLFDGGELIGIMEAK